jgi:sulfate permease, SulP family
MTAHGKTTALRPRFPSSLGGDIKGGAARALISLTLALTLGLVAFGGLGAEHADLGVRAAFIAVAFGAPVVSLLRGTPIPGAGVRTSTTLILAALIASLATDASLGGSGSDRIQSIVFLASTSLALAGLFQVGLGLARLGTLARFVPYPVVAGFMSGVAILIVLAQIPYLIGLDAPAKGRALARALLDPQPWTLLIGLVTIAFIWYVAPRFARFPSSLLGLLVGTALYYVVAEILPAAHLGARLGNLSAAFPLPTMLVPLGSRAGVELLASYWPPVVGTAAALAVIGSLDSLLAAAAVDVAHNTRHHPNRELVGLGLGNLVSAAFGGLPISFSPNLALAARRSGARGQASAWVTAGAALTVWMLGARTLGLIPLTVLAGIMVTVGFGMVDQWTREVVAQSGRRGLTRETRWSIAVLVTVCIVTVYFNFVVAVLFGLIASMALFITSMDRSLVRATWTGAQRTSRRVYSAAQMQKLRARAAAIRVLELEGAVFFGTVHRLAREVEALARSARFIILDFRRITTIDATGAVMLEQLSKRLAPSGTALFLAHISPGGRHGRALVQYRTFLDPPQAGWFEDVDRALEAAETALLAEDSTDMQGGELSLQATSLLAGLDPDQVERVRALLAPRELGVGEILFREGDPGDRLYVLTRGTVTIFTGDERKGQRIGTFEPGVIFGEMAMLDGAARSATAVADQPAIVHSLSTAALERLRAADPDVASRLLINVGRHLSNRLRFTTDALRAESDVGD